MKRNQHRPCRCHACRAKAKGVTLGPPLPLPEWAKGSGATSTLWFITDNKLPNAPASAEGGE